MWCSFHTFFYTMPANLRKADRACDLERCAQIDNLRAETKKKYERLAYLQQPRCPIAEDKKGVEEAKLRVEIDENEKACEALVEFVEAEAAKQKVKQALVGVGDALKAHDSAMEIGERAARKEEEPRKKIKAGLATLDASIKLRQREEVLWLDAARVFPLATNYILESNVQEGEKQEDQGELGVCDEVAPDKPVAEEADVVEHKTTSAPSGINEAPATVPDEPDVKKYICSKCGVYGSDRKAAVTRHEKTCNGEPAEEAEARSSRFLEVDEARWIGGS